MRYILIAILLTFSPLAQANEPVVVEKSIVCNWAQPLLENLRKTHREEPVWIGLGDDGEGRYSLFVNPKTGAFTIVQFNNEIACLIGTGKSSQKILPKSSL